MSDKIIELQNFILAVKTMRDAQIQYFKTRDLSWLTLAKQLEKDVDKYLADFYEPNNP